MQNRNQFFEILSRGWFDRSFCTPPLRFNGRSDREMASFNLEPASIWARLKLDRVSIESLLWVVLLSLLVMEQFVVVVVVVVVIGDDVVVVGGVVLFLK